MAKENKVKHTNNNNESKRWISVIGFFISVTLLAFAIFLSIKQEKVDRLASTKEYEFSNYTLSTSSEINTRINSVLSDEIGSNAPIVINETIEEQDNNMVIIEESAPKSNNEKNEEDENKNDYSNQAEDKINNQEIKEESEKKQFIKPVEGDIYKDYSMDSLVYSDTLQEWVTHRGIDIQANASDEVKASASGTVKSIKNDPRYGWSITIEHNDGFSTVYTCLREVNIVKEGDKIEQGEVIAKVGNSGVFESADGSHLHFEMIKDGGYINPEMYIK
ncbi:MAG: M23 family metallopeptidase [Clostridia bacterium]|nr:M23 family metallopeptidase [Clostridia bacterium]MBR3324609.1 M23 family metallopeptidase [Clostridia bacterium]